MRDATMPAVRADGSSQTAHDGADLTGISDGEGTESSSTPHRARETRSMHVAQTALRSDAKADDRRRLQRTTGGCSGRPAVATDDGRLQRTTGGCSGRPAADDVQQTPRGSDAVPAWCLRPTACSYRQRRTSHRCGLAWHHLAWMSRCVTHEHNHSDRRPHRNEGADSPI